MRLFDATNGDGGDGGGGTTTTTTTAAPGTTTTTTPSAFDWKASGGLDDTGMALVTERGWKAPADLLTSYRNLEKLTGVPAEQIVKLPKGMDPALMGEVYDKLGRPKTPTEYKIDPDGKETPYTKHIAAAMHEAGLTTAQAQKLAAKQQEFVEKQNADIKAEYDAKVQADTVSLKGEWKENYDTNLNVAKSAARTFGMTMDQINSLEQVLGLAGTHKFLFNIGAKLGEAEFVQNGGNPGEFRGMSPELARAELSRITKDRAFIEQFNSKDPTVRAEARAKKARLTQIGYP